jgi:hypothetical protein
MYGMVLAKNRLFSYQQKVKKSCFCPPVKAYTGSKATVPLVLKFDTRCR